VAPLPNAPGVVKVALVGSEANDVDVVTRFYLHYSGTAPVVADLATFGTAIGTAWNSDLASLTDSGYTLTAVELTDLTSPTSASDVVAVSHAGTKTGAPVALDTAFVVSYEIGRRYRGGHPRGYWRFGNASDLQSAQTWTSALVSAVSSGIGSFFTAVLAAGWTGAGTLEQVNVSYYSGFTVVVSSSTGRARNVPTVRGTVVQDTVTSRIARSHVGTQRRRAQY
jgi:hypothetical protein